MPLLLRIGERNQAHSPNVLHVLKRRTGWSRGVRWLPWIAAVVLALVIAWALFAPVADWLARHDIGSVTGPLHETAVDNARGRLLTLGAGLFAAGALLFTARNFALSRQGQVTDRYTKAIEQLGSDKLDVRIGGIYALERIARDSARDHPVVMEVLTAFVREHSREKWSRPGPPGLAWIRRLERFRFGGGFASARPDIQAAFAVVGRRDARRDVGPIDLFGANLATAKLLHADLQGAILSDADLRVAVLAGARLSKAILEGANLREAYLDGADLRDANLITADLTRAHLEDADLSSARLRDADLTRADLTGADLTNADLTGADLTRADLTNADFAGADLSGSRWWPGDAPYGWELAVGSGRLRRAAIDPGPAEAS